MGTTFHLHWTLRFRGEGSGPKKVRPERWTEVLLVSGERMPNASLKGTPAGAI